MRRLGLAAVVVNVGIVVTGAAVRLTASGLGCPTWPRCTGRSYTPEADIHGYIEFGNRMLTSVVSAVAIACIVAALVQRPRRRPLLLLSCGLLAGVAAQALLGGVTVLTGLHPLTVAAHFLLSMPLIAAAVALHVRAGEPDGPAVSTVRRELRWLGRGLLACVAVTLALGTLVTGSGPHSGDEQAQRLPFDPSSVSQLHADAVFLLLGLLVGYLLLARVTSAPPVVMRRATVLLGVTLAQGTVGYVQYFTGLPVVLVGLHVLGATLVWVAALRLLLATRLRQHADPPAGEPAPGGTSDDRIRDDVAIA